MLSNNWFKSYEKFYEIFSVYLLLLVIVRGGVLGGKLGDELADEHGDMLVFTVNNGDTISWKFSNSGTQSPNAEILSILETSEQAELSSELLP